MMKNMTKTFGAVALTLGLLGSATTASATTYDTASLKEFRTVHTKADVYSKPSETAKILGSFTPNEAVIIERPVNKTFTKIRFGFDTGYVKTSTLKKAKANKGTTYAKNIEKTYTYVLPQNKGSDYATRYTTAFKRTMNYNDSSVNFWFANSQPDAQGVTEYDTSKGLYVGNVDSGKLELALRYPVKKHATFKSLYGQKAKIIATNQTLKLHKHTYRHVVVVKNGNATYYYAPQVGLIKQTFNGQTYTTLSSIQ